MTGAANIKPGSAECATIFHEFPFREISTGEAAEPTWQFAPRHLLPQGRGIVE
jgi:hypothetical protein